MMQYLRILLGIANLVVTFGFLLPWLISSDNTIMVLVGVFILFVYTPMFVWWYFRKDINNLIETWRNKEHD